MSIEQLVNRAYTTWAHEKGTSWTDNTMREAFENCSLHDDYVEVKSLEENRKWFSAGWQAAQSVPTRLPTDAAFRWLADNAVEPEATVQKLGKRLAELLDEHHFSEVEALLSRILHAQSVPVGLKVSVDVGTGEHDSFNRVFATVTGQQDDGQGGVIILCEEESRNFEPSVPVMGEPVGFILIHENGGRNLTFHDNTDDLADGWSQHKLIIQPTTSITAQELDALRRCKELLAEARDDVSEQLNHMLPLAGYPSNDKRISKQRELLAAIDAAIAAEGAK